MYMYMYVDMTLAESYDVVNLKNGHLGSFASYILPSTFRGALIREFATFIVWYSLYAVACGESVNMYIHSIVMSTVKPILCMYLIFTVCCGKSILLKKDIINECTIFDNYVELPQGNTFSWYPHFCQWHPPMLLVARHTISCFLNPAFVLLEMPFVLPQYLLLRLKINPLAYFRTLILVKNIC